MSIKIVVDADACPVKQEIIEAACEWNAQVVMVASYDHQLPQVDGVQTIQVDRSDQSVDLYISNVVTRQNILITQDLGLAAIGLAKGAIVLSFRGQIISESTIDFLLESRHERAKKRRSGRHIKGPRSFTNSDRQKFLQTLTKVLSSMQEY